MLIALTGGEPAGIGPELTIKLASQSLPCPFVVLGDIDLLKTTAKFLNVNCQFIEFDKNHPPLSHKKNKIYVHSIRLTKENTLGEPQVENVDYVLETLQTAVEFCLQEITQAIVTNPIQKSIIKKSGLPFIGQTEYFADSCQCKTIMMLANDQMKVVPLTTHLPLRDVSQAINQEKIIQTLTLLNHELITKFNINQPKILVSGLNPHAGEQGEMGHEEQEIIIPAIKLLKQKNINVEGPYPADTLFTKKYLQQADAILCMYHDQGLPVVKYSDFNHSVNISLGLPFVRTSVDHGTALDIAGLGSASVDSLLSAFNMAWKLTDVKKTT